MFHTSLKYSFPKKEEVFRFEKLRANRTKLQEVLQRSYINCSYGSMP